MEDDEGCEMYDGDKIGCTAIGTLNLSKRNNIINDFEDCQKLIEKFHKVGKHFSKSSKKTTRLNETKQKHADINPSKNITVDLNKTQFTAVHILINDCLRMKKGLQYYELDFDINTLCWPTVADWQQAGEVEGMLDLLGAIYQLLRNAKKMNGGKWTCVQAEVVRKAKSLNY